MAWSAPRTWVTGELVTSPIMNQHVRDNLNVIRAELGGKAIHAERALTLTADGASRFVSGVEPEVACGIDWVALAAQGTIQWRTLGGVYVSAVNGATAITFNMKIWREWSLNVTTAAHILLGAYVISLSVGWKNMDSGWVNVPTPPLGDGHGVYRASYSIDFATAAPTMSNHNLAWFLRVI